MPNSIAFAKTYIPIIDEVYQNASVSRVLTSSGRIVRSTHNAREIMIPMVTGVANKLSLAHDYAIREWEAAGLDRPSIARLDRIAEIPAGYLGTAGRIGRLADGDIAAIKTILAEITR